MNAYTKGRTARDNEWACHYNPYASGTWEFDQWNKGWLNRDAQLHREGRAA